MKTIRTERELLNYLKSVAQKSIIDASSNLFESDSYVAKFANELEKEMDSLKEQEEAEEAEEEEAEVEPAAEEEEAEAKPAKPKRNPAAEKALSLPDYETDQEVTFEQILTAINLVRAGNSTKNKKTKQEISDYFEKLDEQEKGVLLIYLKELAKIITGAIDGEKGHDPSDATTFFDITVKRDEIPPDQKEKSPQSKSKPKADVQPQQPRQKKGEEDVTPPIRVNERQDYTGLKIIRG